MILHTSVYVLKCSFTVIHEFKVRRMSDDAKPAYLRGRGNRGRGTTCHAATGDRGIQRPGRQNKEWSNQDALSTDHRLSKDSATSNSDNRGNYAFESGIMLRCSMKEPVRYEHCTGYKTVK